MLFDTDENPLEDGAKEENHSIQVQLRAEQIKEYILAVALV